MASATSFSSLFPELFTIISAHIPLVYRPSTLLSLALTCHRLHEVVIPHLLYHDVRLVGEDQALPTLNTLIAKAQLVNEEDIQGSLSHCIHRLCIESSIIRTPDHSVNALQKLVDVDGLRHLSDLTLHIKDNTFGTIFPSSFFISLQAKCPHLTNFTQGFGKESGLIKLELFSFESLTSIRVEGYCPTWDPIPIKFSQLPPNLHTLELRLKDGIDASGPGGLFKSVIPNLNTLILDDFTVSDSNSANTFWRAHPGIKRLELGHKTTGTWFDNFEVGMLPNLRYLQCDVLKALVLFPHVSKLLIKLSLLDTYNAQGLYLLRAIVPEGILPALRSLSIHLSLDWGFSPREGDRWREDVNGVVSQAGVSTMHTRFDGNYIMSISKAAPNLEELELMGGSNDTLNSITASLSRFPKLQRLTLSGAINYIYDPFFSCSYDWAEYTNINNFPTYYGIYAPESFDEAARDLADGCRTLDVVTMGNRMGDLHIIDGLSARIVRESEGGVVKEVKRIRAWGNIIGREEEW